MAPIPVNLDYKPRDWQHDLHFALTKQKRAVVALHRQGGKSQAAMMHLIRRAVEARTNLPLFAYVAPELRQARSNMWDRLKSKLEPLRAAGGLEISESELWVQFKDNKAKIRLFGASDPDTLRGLTLDGVVVDEVAQVKPFVWTQIIMPMLAVKDGWALFIGTPKGINLFSQLYFDAVKDPLWFAKTWTCYETDALKASAIAEMKAKMSPMEFAREMLCDFNAQSDDQLIPMSLAVEASQRMLKFTDRVITSAPIILGVDPARFGDDRSVICRRQGLACFTPLIFHKIDNYDLAHKVAWQIQEHKPAAVCIDAGMGAGVIDILRRQLGHTVSEVPFGGKATKPGFFNRRAEMWWNMKEWLKSGGVIPPDDTLIRELATPVYWMNEMKDQIVLESKDTIKERLRGGDDGEGGSPDIADALALTFALDLKSETSIFEDHLRFGRPGRYKPFDRDNPRRG